MTNKVASYAKPQWGFARPLNKIENIPMTKKELFPETPKEWALDKLVTLLDLYIEGWFGDEIGCFMDWPRKGVNPPIRHQEQLCRTALNLRRNLAHQIGADDSDFTSLNREPRFHE